MSESLPSIVGEGGIEQASWVNLPDVDGFWQSWKNRNIQPGLMDGAYFGLNGSPIFDTEDRCVCGESRGEIAVCNPGVKKISDFLRYIFHGKILVTLDGTGNADCEVSMVEALNEGLIAEKTYPEVWEYLGVKTLALNPVQECLIRRGTVPAEVYQVTKAGAGRLGIAERNVDRPSIFYFFGLRPRI